MLNAILDALLAYASSYIKQDESKQESDANRDIACKNADSSTIASITPSSTLREDYSTNSFSSEDNDMTASEEDEFLLAAKLLNHQPDENTKEDEEHALIVAAKLLEESVEPSPSRKRARGDVETVDTKRRRIQFKSVTIYNFQDDLGASSIASDGFSIGMKFKHCTTATHDFSNIIDDPEDGRTKVKKQPQFKPNGKRIKLCPIVKRLDLNNRWMRLARAGVTAAQMEAYRNKVEKIFDDVDMAGIDPNEKWRRQMAGELARSMKYVPLVLEKVKRFEKQREERECFKIIQSNEERVHDPNTADILDYSKKRSAMATPGKSILKRRKI